MERITATFWTLIALLLSASLFFALNAEQQRKSVQIGSGKIDNGDLVRLVKVVDGDTVQVVREGQQPVTVAWSASSLLMPKWKRMWSPPLGRQPSRPSRGRWPTGRLGFCFMQPPRTSTDVTWQLCLSMTVTLRFIWSGKGWPWSIQCILFRGCRITSRPRKRPEVADVGSGPAMPLPSGR